MSTTIEVDAAVHAADIRLSNDAVERTVEFDDLIQVDLDAFGVAVGIEVLDEGVQLPFAALVDDFHVHSDVVELLRLVRPRVSSLLQFTTGNDGDSAVKPAGRAVTDMATVSIRGIDDSVRDALRIRAARHGRSMEAEIRVILADVVREPGPSDDLFTALLDRFSEPGGVDVVLPPRTTPDHARTSHRGRAGFLTDR